MKYRIRILATLLVLCLLAGLAACGKKPAGEPLFAERGELERASLGDYAPAKDAKAVREALTAAGQTRAAELDREEAEVEPGLDLELSKPPEGDVVVTDGAYIYMLDSYGLIIFSVAGKDSEPLSYTKIQRGGASWSEAMYLAGDRMAVVYTADEADSAAADSAAVHTVLLDLSDRRAPKKLTETALEGKQVGACLLDGALVLVTQKSWLTLPKEDEELLPKLWEDGKELSLKPGELYLSPEPAKPAVTLTAALRMEDGRILDALAFTDGVEAVCLRDGEICLSRTLWTETASAPRQEAPYTVVDYSTTARTELKCLRLEGTLRLTGGCVLEGALSDPAALDPRGELLRIVTDADSRSFSSYTDEAHGWTNYEIHSHSRGSALAVLDAGLQSLGALTSLGGTRGIGACCFVGDTAWFSAAGSRSAVYTADLSDPAKPVMTDSFPVQGERLLLRAFGEGLVLGLVSPEAGEPWKLVMYDLSDPAHPREADSLSLKSRVPASELSNPAALFTDAANCLLGFPVSGSNGNEYLLVRWTGSQLKQKGTLALEYVPANARGLLLDGLLYICSPPGEIYVADPETMTVLATVSNAAG